MIERREYAEAQRHVSKREIDRPHISNPAKTRCPRFLARVARVHPGDVQYAFFARPTCLLPFFLFFPLYTPPVLARLPTWRHIWYGYRYEE